VPSREASLTNLAKARAAWSHPPRPWRSAHESRVIKRLVWQWFNSQEPRNRKWSGRAVAKWLGVTHTYIQKLAQQFTADPTEMQREALCHNAATFEHLNRAREETRKEKERGWLRPPRRWKVAEFEVGGVVARVVVPTKAEERRQAAEVSGRPLGPVYIPFHELPLWARGLPYYSAESPCDPLAAVNHAMLQCRESRRVSVRRWRPGMQFRH
jgi:hypothetical protein